MLAAILCLLLFAPEREPQQDPEVASFELIWSTLRDHYWDAKMAGRDWQTIHDTYRPLVSKAKDHEEAAAVMSRMIHLLPSSHLALIPAELYRRPPTSAPQPTQDSQAGDDEDESGDVGLTIVAIENVFAVERVDSEGPAGKSGVRPGWTIQSVADVPVGEFLKHTPPGSLDDRRLFAQEMMDRWLHGPQGSTVTVVFRRPNGESVTRELVRQSPTGELVEFGNLPPEHVVVERRLLEKDAGYLRLNVFLDPVLVMPEIERALKEFRNTRGMVLDLRGNPGGLGIMAMGIAGWFVSQRGQRLGTMTSRSGDMPFEINPRLDSYGGHLAILVDQGSASTTEILAQGLKDLGRARIFGTRTAGAALPSEIIQLPDGDRFQYPEANYTSMKGRVLEGNGVQPDIVVRHTLAALEHGHDLPLERAVAWIKSAKERNAQ